MLTTPYKPTEISTPYLPMMLLLCPGRLSISSVAWQTAFVGIAKPGKPKAVGWQEDEPGSVKQVASPFGVAAQPTNLLP